MPTIDPIDDRSVAEGHVLDRLWRRNQFGEPPRAQSALKRELLNRIGVMDDYIDALIAREIGSPDLGAA